MRKARSRTSGKYLFDFFMTPSSQELKPPQNPGRFIPAFPGLDGRYPVWIQPIVVFKDQAVTGIPLCCSLGQLLGDFAVDFLETQNVGVSARPGLGEALEVRGGVANLDLHAGHPEMNNQVKLP